MSATSPRSAGRGSQSEMARVVPLDQKAQGIRGAFGQEAREELRNQRERSVSWASSLNVNVFSEGTGKVKARTANRFTGNGR